MRIYRCKECGWICRAEMKGNIGTAHAHAEKHAPGTILGYKLPTTLFPTANPKILGKYIEEITVKMDRVARENCYGNPAQVEE